MISLWVPGVFEHDPRAHLRWASNLLRCHDRRSDANIIAQAMANDTINPLVTLVGFRPSDQIKFCSMHTVNLGFGQTHAGSCLELLLSLGC